MADKTNNTPPTAEQIEIERLKGLVAEKDKQIEAGKNADKKAAAAETQSATDETHAGGRYIVDGEAVDAEGNLLK